MRSFERATGERTGRTRKGREVSEKPPAMRRSGSVAHPEEPKFAISWAVGIARDGRTEQTVPMVAEGCIIGAAQDAKTEILVNGHPLAPEAGHLDSSTLGNPPHARYSKHLGRDRLDQPPHGS